MRSGPDLFFRFFHRRIPEMLSDVFPELIPFVKVGDDTAHFIPGDPMEVKDQGEHRIQIFLIVKRLIEIMSHDAAAHGASYGEGLMEGFFPGVGGGGIFKEFILQLCIDFHEFFKNRGGRIACVETFAHDGAGMNGMHFYGNSSHALIVFRFPFADFIDASDALLRERQDEGLKNFVLIFIQIINAPCQYAGLIHNLADGGLLVTLGRKEVLGRIQDLPAHLDGVLPGPLSSLHNNTPCLCSRSSESGD